jgi:GAF domain-containing protein
MYDFQTNADAPKSVLYDDLLSAARALVADEPDTIANMANIAALMWQFLPGLNWAGFYRVVDGGLILGPFMGKPACIRIAMDQGVCGAAATSGETQCVEDVHAFPGHIACDGDTLSELVVPVFAGQGVDRHVVAVIDLDSPLTARFDGDDAKGIERLAQLMEACFSA